MHRSPDDFARSFCMCFYSVWAFEVHHSAAKWGLLARLHVFYQWKWPWCLPNLIWLHLASQSQKWSKKHFFPELSGDLWGVICYHHWYPRAGLEGPEKKFFRDARWRLKWCKITPWVFSMRRFGLNPYLELIYQLFKKSYFPYFGAYLEPFRTTKGSRDLPLNIRESGITRERRTSCFSASRTVPR